MNLKIRAFKNSIVNFVYDEDIPIEAKRLVLKEIYDDLSRKADEAVLAELNASEKEEAENTEMEAVQDE